MMHLPKIGAMALWPLAASAFQNTSPFLFFSTSEILFSSPQISTASSLSRSLSTSLSSCPSSTYVVVHQAGVYSSDYTSDSAPPQLKRYVSGTVEGVMSSFSVAEVLRDSSTVPVAASIEEMLRKECDAQVTHLDPATGMYDYASGATAQIVKIVFAAPPLEEEKRRSAMRVNDLFLSNLLGNMPGSDYTVLYTTSPSLSSTEALVEQESTSYQMDSALLSSLNMELKRDLGYKRADSNDTFLDRKGPLFEKYQFLTPALFMGLLVMFFLMSIMFVAVRAIASIEVTYSAFDKDQGPSAQKKAQ